MKKITKISLSCLLAATMAFATHKSLATVYSLDVPLTGMQEVPPNNSTGLGSLIGTYDDVSNTLSFTVAFTGLTATTVAAHLHGPASPGVNAPVIIGFVGFPVGVTSGAYTNSYILTPVQESMLFCGLVYVNVHTTVYPGGEIRGQVMEASFPNFDITINAASEVPPNPSTGLGNLTASYDTVSNTLNLNVRFTGLSAPTTAAHLHGPAPAGINAPVIIGFAGFPAGVTSGSYANTYVLTNAQEAELLAGLWYINIHTSTYPGGEIRGQLAEGTFPTGVTIPVGPITGTYTVDCIPLQSYAGLSYSIPAISGATYNWTAPAGMTIASGQGTNAILVDMSLSAVHLGIIGQMCVEVINGCQSGTACTDIALQIAKPVKPNSIAGPVKVCVGDVVVYSTNPVSRAAYYQWSLPAGLSGSSSETSITVTVEPGFTGGTIGVQAGNDCGLSPARARIISLINCVRTGNDETANKVSIYPNPARDQFTLTLTAAAAANVNLMLRDMTGRIVLSENKHVEEGVNTFTINLDNIAKGFYLLQLESGYETQTTKLIVE